MCVPLGSDWASRVSAYEQIRDLLRIGGASALVSGSTDASHLVATVIEHAGTQSRLLAPPSRRKLVSARKCYRCAMQPVL